MKLMASHALVAAAALLVLGQGAQAQGRRNFNVTPLNFDLWCQETMGWSFDRCGKRQPADIEAFESFRDKIQAQEIPHLQQKARDARIEADILHSDPVDRSPTSTLQAQGLQGGVTPPRPNTVP
jgi:hypothetical protein